MSNFTGDRATGAILFVFGLWFTWIGTTLKSSFVGDALGPGTFPVLLGVLLCVLSILLILKPEEGYTWPHPRGWLRIGLVTLSLLAYAYVIEPLGYILATTLEMFALSLIFGGPRLRSLAASLVFSAALFVLFFYILDLRLPTGDIFEGLIR